MLTFQHKVMNITSITPISYLFFMHLSGATSHSLYWIVWEAVRRLEEMKLKVGYCVALSILLLYYIIQVMAFVCDSAKPLKKEGIAGTLPPWVELDACGYVSLCVLMFKQSLYTCTPSLFNIIEKRQAHFVGSHKNTLQ